MTLENVEEPCDCDNGRIWTYYSNGPWYTIPCPDCTPENVEEPKVDMRHCGHEWCDCGCYGRPHCKMGCGMKPPPENVEEPT